MNMHQPINQYSPNNTHLQDPDNTTDIDTILSFYENDDDTTNNTMSLLPGVFSQLSQASNLSATDLSVMDNTSIQESMHSQLSSSHHHQTIEMDRQRVKLERRKRNQQRESSSVMKKKKRKQYILSTKQIERRRMYRRIKYEKSIDLSNEVDVGDSMEYIVRDHLNTEEMQSKLMQIARTREEVRRKEERDVLDCERGKLWGMIDNDGIMGKEKAVDSNNDATAATESRGDDTHEAAPSKSSSGPNWNFQQEGYVTMPSGQAKELSYYIYNILSERKSLVGMMDDGEEGLITSDSVNNNSCTSSISYNFDEEGLSKSGRTKCSKVSSTRRKKPRNNKNIIQWDDDHDTNRNSFPLYFNQLNPKLDLRSFTTWNNMGQENMILLHGRLARRLWIRMIAGGVTCNTIRQCLPNRLLSSTTAAADDNNHDQAIKQELIDSDMSNSSQSSESSVASVDIYGSSDYRSQFNQSTILDTGSVGNVMDQGHESNDPIHILTSLIHGLPRYTHRNRFYLKVATELGGLRQLWETEIQPNLPVLEPKLSCMELRALKSFLGVDGGIPFWCSDPAMSTDVNRLYKRMQKMRLKLIPRLRRLIRSAGGSLRVDSKTTVQEISDPGEVVVNDAVDAKSGESTEKTAIDEKTTSNTSGIETKQDSIDIQPVKSDEADDVNTGEVDVSNNYMPELSGSLLGATDEADSSLERADKYAKVVHEADMDVTNISVALSSFLNELTTSSVKNNTEMWSETIDEYLSLVESQSRPADMNLNKRDGKVPQCSTLATSVLIRQAYTSNSGIKGRIRRQKSNIKTEEDEEYEEVDNYPTEDYGPTQELQTIQQSGNDLIKRGRDYLLNDNLQLFTSIHLTTGVAMLSEHLTPLSAEIISKPYSPDDPYARTPFELIMKTLVCLEENDQLISRPTDAKSRWDARGKVIDQVLVNSWESAAVIFRRCVKEDPHTVDNWLWYVGTLLGIVCVSSGVRMTSKTLLKMVDSKYEDSFDQSHDEVRYQLDFYDEKRVYASKAIEDLIKVAEKEDCPVFHMGVSSILEWDHVMNLLDGEASQLGYDLSASEVRRLFVDHTYKWAVANCSQNAINKVQTLYQSHELALDDCLNVLASAVEANPTKVTHWYELATALTKLKAGTQDSANVQYSMFKNRGPEWSCNYFHLPPSSSAIVKSEFVSMVLDTVDLDSPALKDHGNEAYDVTSIHHKKLSADPMCEALCLKIVVAKYMIGEYCDFVCDSIWWMAVKHWRCVQKNGTNKNTSAYLDGLNWLSCTAGILVIECVEKKQLQSLEYEKRMTM
eukprot:scaffold19997_cov84-Cyclotella_meneghiniana.AAC.9